MPLNLDAVGSETPPLLHSYRWQDVVLYALSVGAMRDSELECLIEQHGPRVLPTFAVIPALPAVAALFDRIGGNMLGVVHGAQAVTLHKSFAPSGTLQTTGKIAAVYDLKRLAQAIVTTKTVDDKGDLVAETEWNILYRFDGDFGGPPPPKRPLHNPPQREPDWSASQTTSLEQALLYRLNGDLNPLHSDPKTAAAAGFPNPILHGLCTYGYAARATILRACSAEFARLKGFSGQFRKPVFPGETLITHGWNERDGVIVRVVASHTPGEPVFQGVAQVQED